MFEALGTWRARRLVARYEAEFACRDMERREASALAVRVLEFSAAVTAHNAAGGSNSVNARFETIANQEVTVECREKLEAVFSALDQRDQEAVCALEALKARLTG